MASDMSYKVIKNTLSTLKDHLTFSECYDHCHVNIINIIIVKLVMRILIFISNFSLILVIFEILLSINVILLLAGWRIL